MLPGLVISLASLAFVFYLADIDQMVESLRLADLRIVLAAFGLSFVWLAVRAMVWRTLLQDRASYSQVFFTTTEGYLLNNILPFRLGEVGRAFLLSRKAKLDFWQVFSSILIERTLDLAMAAGLLLSILPLVVGAAWAQEAALVAGGLVIGGLVMLFFLARNRIWALQQLAKLSERWPALKKFTGERLDGFINGLEPLTNARRFLKAITWMALDWGIAGLQYYVLLLAFFPQARPLWAGFSLGVAALGIAAPSSPGALGVLELSLVGALSVFGLNHSVALAFALTTHLFNYVANGSLGAYALGKDGESLQGLYLRLREPRQREP